ncbi:MAG: DUF4349 domain-containing protein [Anaerolineales bacterium]|nr:DUF4349 domain-containing protein [Anaerolineales bacterium]
MNSKMMISSRYLLTCLLALVLLLAGCSYASSTPQMMKEAGEGMAPEPAMDREYEMAANQEMTPGSSGQAIQRIVIKNASLSLAVDNPAESAATIARMADELGGYVVAVNVYQQELDSGAKVPRASLTIRVPAEKLNDALDSIKKESEQDPISENVNSQDVTSEYTDLQSRLRNLEATEVQLTKILEKAEKTEDVLSVYNQLVQYREQIEVTKGQIKYYEESAALSSVSVELMANEAVQPLTIGGWQPAGVAKDAVQTLINTLKFLANLLIWVVIYLLPVLLVLYVIFVLPISLLVRAWKKRRKINKKPAPPPAEDQS